MGIYAGNSIYNVGGGGGGGGGGSDIDLSKIIFESHGKMEDHFWSNIGYTWGQYGVLRTVDPFVLDYAKNFEINVRFSKNNGSNKSDGYYCVIGFRSSNNYRFPCFWYRNYSGSETLICAVPNVGGNGWVSDIINHSLNDDFYTFTVRWRADTKKMEWILDNSILIHSETLSYTPYSDSNTRFCIGSNYSGEYDCRLTVDLLKTNIKVDGQIVWGCDSDAGGGGGGGGDDSVFIESTNYPTKQIGNLVWLTANLCEDFGDISIRRKLENGEIYYRADEITDGDLQAKLPAGWRIPTKADFDDLINNMGTYGYNYLSNGYTSNNFHAFEATLTGYIQSGTLTNNGERCLYPTTTPDGGNYVVFDISGESLRADDSGNLPFTTSMFFTVRLCKNA